MRCFRCGTDVAESARFCSNCGTQVSDPHEATMLVPPEDAEEILRRVRMVLAGEYEVERELGRGGMAMVFKATEQGLGRTVALKVLPPESGLTARASERFRREARVVAELDHPNIIPVYRVGQVGGLLFIVMKLVEGRSLDTILAEQGALPLPVVLYVLRGVSRALAYAHERGIVHRDVKGGNVLIDQDGRVLVSDFGVALRSSDVTLTTDGSLIGTPSFMSPEQCAGQRAGPQSDQYSVGIMAFQMLTGRVPFQSETLQGVMQHHFFTPVPDLRSARSDIPEALIAVIEKSLAKEATDRFDTTRDLLQALEAIPFAEEDWKFSEQTLRRLTLGETVERVDTKELPVLPDARTLSISSPGRRSRSRWMRQAAVVGGLALVGAGAAWWMGRSSSGPLNAADAPVTLLAAPTHVDPHPQVSGKLRLLTSPPNAEILIDGRRLGVGSVFDAAVAAGPHRLRIQLVGFEPLDTLIAVASDQTLSLGRIQLRPRKQTG
jgi:serine/threonine protein kinase